jgi:EAL domain-containing protein (putative c-di-GMP-specific phosphodiesterase class I)
MRGLQAGPVFTADEILAGLKNDQFEPFFQPKIEVSSGRITGAETLARWRHPKHGMVAPYAFIKPLEQHGLIDELTWVMLKKAASHCAAWRATGQDLSVSVNLSVESLADPQLARARDRMRA